MPFLFAAAPHDFSPLFIELGVLVLGIAFLTRLAARWQFSPIPLYLLAGLAFGNGGLVSVHFSEGIVSAGGEIGVLLLLFMLGLEYSSDQLGENLQKGTGAGALDWALNFWPGFLWGLVAFRAFLPALLLGGVTWVSSSGVIAKVLGDLGRLKNRETPAVLSVLVLEDLAMAVYLPLVAVLLLGQSFGAAVVSISIALVTVGVVLLIALRYSEKISELIAHGSDEVLLFSTFGLMLLVAGVAQKLQVSSAVGAFLVGVALSGPIVKRTHRLLSPLRDLFAAIFFLFFSLQIDPATLLPVLPSAGVLGLLTALTKILTGWWAAGRTGADATGRFRAGAALVARGEFSLVIAGLGATLEPRLGPLAAAYVLFLAILGPLLTRFSTPVGRVLMNLKA